MTQIGTASRTRSPRAPGLADERGSTMIEFSIVLMMLLTVMFGIIELGRLMLVYTTISHAARTGIRYAIVHGGNRTDDGTVDGASGPSTTNGTTRVMSAVQTAASPAGTSLSTSSSCTLSASSGCISVSYCSDSSQVNGSGLCTDGSTPSNAVSSPVTITVTYLYAPIVSFVPLRVTLHSTTQGVICY